MQLIAKWPKSNRHKVKQRKRI